MADRSVTVRLGASVTGFVNGIRVAERSAVDFGRNATRYGEQYGRQLDTIGAKAGILGTGLVALAGFAVKSAVDWETAWTGVSKTVNGTPAQLKAIENGLRTMATQIPVSAEELAGIAESAGALGVQTDSILSFTRVMADLGQTTNLTSDEAATSIAQLMNVMQTAPGDVDRLGATLVDLGNKGASTEKQIVEMAQNIAGAGSIVGLSEANVLALGNALASSGIDAEAGGSAISNVLIDITKSVDTGSDKLQGFSQVAGLSAKDFATKWKGDPAEALTDFVEGLGRMNDAGGNVFGTLSDLGESDVRVTRALLNMAASGDMLRESLANGDAAWDKNTALAIEASKRYDTTASKVQMSWNEIKSSAIDAGQSMLPVVAGIADGVDHLMGAFQALPGPVKSAMTAVAGISGVALLAVAGVAKLTTSIAEARLAQAALATGSPVLATRLAFLSRTATAAAIAIGAYTLAGKLGPGGGDVATVNKFTKALLGVADGSDAAKKQLDGLADLKGSRTILAPFNDMGNSVHGLKDAFDGLDTNKLDDFMHHLTPYDDKVDSASKVVGQLDSALTAMVSSGATDQAAAAFDYIAESTGRSTSELKKFLPGYTDALVGTSTQQKLTAISTDKLNAAMGDAPQMSDAAAKALQDARDKAHEAGTAFVGLGDDLNNSKVSLDGWLKQLDAQAKALRDFTKNAKDAGKKGLDDGLIQSLQDAGPEGALRMKELADGTQAQIKRANKSWRDGQEAIDDYTDAVAAVPKTATTKVDITGSAYVLQQLNAMNAAAKKAGSGVHYATGVGGGITRAEGGAIVGPGTGTSDSILAALSNGEHVLTADEVNKAGGQQAIYRLRAALRAGVLPAFASGGAVSDAQSRYDTFGDLTASSKLDLAHQQQQINDLEKQLREKTTVGKGKHKHKVLTLRGYDRKVAQMELVQAKADLAQMKADNAALKGYGTEAEEKARLDEANTTADQADAASTAADNIAGTTLDVTKFSSPAAIDRYLNGLISNIADFTTVLQKLKAKGAAPWLLKQLQAAGPTKAAIRLGQRYLNDPVALANLNSEAAVLDQVSGGYGALTTAEQFSGTAAWAGPALPSQLLVSVSTLDQSAFAAETTRQVTHSLTTLAAGGGL